MGKIVAPDLFVGSVIHGDKVFVGKLAERYFLPCCQWMPEAADKLPGAVVDAEIFNIGDQIRILVCTDDNINQTVVQMLR